MISFHAAVIAQCKQQLPQLKAYWLVGYKQDETTGAGRPAAKKYCRHSTAAARMA